MKNKIVPQILFYPIAFIAVFIFILVIPFLPFLLFIQYVKGYWLNFQVQRQWFPQGKWILFVYSNSPKWKDDIESTIIPKINSKSIILNWSEHKTWPKSLASKIFFYYSKTKKTKNKVSYPIAIIFKSLSRPKVIELRQAYRDFNLHRNNNILTLKKELISQ